MKSVMVHISDDDAMDSRLQTALDITRANNGHLICLHVTPVSAYTAFDGFGGVFIMGNVIDKVNDTISKVKQHVEKVMQHEDVSWDYRHIDSESASGLARLSGLQDIIVLSRPSHMKSTYSPATLFGDILFKADTPLLIVPENSNGFNVAAPALIAWNGSLEAANALRMAIPLLQFAKAVHIVTIEEDDRFDLPPLEAAEYLSRHGISSEIHKKSSAKSNVDEMLVSSAQDFGAGYIVMGAYGSNRIYENIFGGVTKKLLNQCPMHLLIAR